MNAPNAELISTLDHVGIVVPSLEQAVDFFVGYFGASVAFHIDRIIDDTGEAVARLGAKKGTSFALAMLDLGGQRLELLQWWPCLAYGAGSQVCAPNVRGSAHVAIEVSDIQATLERMRAVSGVLILSNVVTFDSGPTPGLRNAFFSTPWGLLIELMSWATNK